MKTTIKWLLAGAIALSSTVMAQADPYDGARAAQRAAAAQREAEAMSNPANCFGQVDYGPPASALSPRVADVYRQAAEKQARFLNSEFCRAERQRVADAQEAQRKESERQAKEIRDKAEAKYKKEMEEKRAWDEAKAAEKKLRDEQLANERARQAELQRQLDAEMKKPENRLHRAYVHLARLQFCRQTRDGYLVVYISEPELERAETATKAIERSALAEKPDLDTDNIWKGALLMMPHGNGEWERAQHAIGIYQASGLWSAYDFSCKQELQALYRESPTGVYQYQKP